MSDNGDASAVLATFFFIGVMWLLIGAWVGNAIGKPKGRGTEGAVLGALLGVIGWIIVAVMQPTPEAEVARLNQIEQLRQGQPAGRSAGQSSAGPLLEDPAWAADPYGRHQHRYFNGRQWTDQVADNGTVTSDQPTHPCPDGDGWVPDPFGRFEQRFHRHGRWTDYVANGSSTSSAPATYPPPSELAPPPPPAAPLPEPN